ncbi:hypothetical protein, partial [Microbacterium sp. B24]|uniref:hypothetical protein n=1 Tax=Microbacterium sp. B24 TaxID=95616 RepID=UPI00055C7E64
PADGQVLPLDDESQDRLILPYSENQIVYERAGAAENTGEGDGPTSAEFHFVEAEDDIDPDPDGRDE